MNGIRQSGKLCLLEKRKWQHNWLGGPSHVESEVGHSRADDVVPFADSLELIANSGLPASALIEVGNDHRLGR